MNKVHAIKALWGSTSKVIIIRARNAQAALDKAFKLKECEGVQDLIYLEERGDEWRDRAI
jgi:hypothetical protein